MVSSSNRDLWRPNPDFSGPADSESESPAEPPGGPLTRDIVRRLSECLPIRNRHVSHGGLSLSHSETQSREKCDSRRDLGFPGGGLGSCRP